MAEDQDHFFSVEIKCQEGFLPTRGSSRHLLLVVEGLPWILTRCWGNLPTLHTIFLGTLPTPPTSKGTSPSYYPPREPSYPTTLPETPLFHLPMDPVNPSTLREIASSHHPSREPPHSTLLPMAFSDSTTFQRTRSPHHLPMDPLIPPPPWELSHHTILPKSLSTPSSLKGWSPLCHPPRPLPPWPLPFSLLRTGLFSRNCVLCRSLSVYAFSSVQPPRAVCPSLQYWHDDFNELFWQMAFLIHKLCYFLPL